MAIKRAKPDMQYGSGIDGGGCDMPHLAAHSVLHLAEARGISASLLFLDVSTAFAAMVREVVLPTDAGREAWLTFLVKHGFVPSFAAEVMGAVQAASVWDQTGLTDHALAVLQDFHTETWFSTELLEKVCSTVRGCTAGNPVADLVYIAVDTLLARNLRKALAEDGLTFQLAGAEVAEFFGLEGEIPDQVLARPAYVDDGVVPVLSAAPKLLEKLERTAAIAHFEYARVGLSLNFKAGKSEAVVAFHGAGAQKARIDAFEVRGGSLRVAAAVGEDFTLRIVPRYRHFGGITSGNGDHMAEIQPKMAMVRQATRQLRRPFLSNPSVAPARKGQVLQSIVLAKGMHLAGCWPLLLPREQRCLHKAIMDMVRAVAKMDTQERRATDAEVISATGVLRPQRLVMLMRLQLAVRLAVRASPQLLVLLFWAREAQKSWIKALESDLVLLGTAPCCAELRGARLAQWFQLFRAHPAEAKRMVVKAVRQLNEPTAEEEEVLRPFTMHCYECGEPQHDRQALEVHLVRAWDKEVLACLCLGPRLPRVWS